ncbi:MAG TPA: glycosyltransferase [Abditibacteriaceae bacterium]
MSKDIKNAEKSSFAGALHGRRIFIVLGEFHMGGAERQALLLARYLRDIGGAHVEVWSTRYENGRVSQECERFGLPWHLSVLKWKPNRFLLLKDLLLFAFSLRRAKPDVILPYVTFQNVVSGIAWRWTGAKTCIWSQREVGVMQLSAKNERLAVRKTPLFISNSALGAHYLVETLHADPEAVHIVHNGVDMDAPKDSRTEWQSRIGWSKEKFYACMIANFNESKDQITLVRAWRDVVDNQRPGENAVLLFAGLKDGAYQQAYEKAYAVVKELNLEEHVLFLGSVDDVSGLLQVVDLGVFSSHSEGCPNGVLECMAQGLAVVGSDIPGVREAVGSEYPFLAPARDASTFARLILQLQRDCNLRHATGKRNLKRIEDDFSPLRLYERTAALIIKGLRMAGQKIPEGSMENKL